MINGIWKIDPTIITILKSCKKSYCLTCGSLIIISVNKHKECVLSDLITIDVSKTLPRISWEADIVERLIMQINIVIGIESEIQS